MLEIAGFVGALIIGITLGLIGGGGSILTVPVLVYLMGVSPVMATAYSLFIVGSSSLVGSIRYAARGLVDFRIAVVFGIPSILSVYFTRRFLIPAIPNSIMEIGSWTLTKDMFLMLLFALLMLVASIGMIRKKKGATHQTKQLEFGIKTTLIVLSEGLVVGVLTGLVGAGGGFLIIPALVLVGGLRMKVAIGTSLLIISIKSLIGFLGDVSNYTMDWGFLALFTCLAVVGIFIGIFAASKVDGKSLKKGFGWFVLLMALIILVSELTAHS